MAVLNRKRIKSIDIETHNRLTMTKRDKRKLPANIESNYKEVTLASTRKVILSIVSYL